MSMKLNKEVAVEFLRQMFPNVEIEIVDEFEEKTEKLPVIVQKQEPKVKGIIPLNEDEGLDAKERRSLFLDLFIGLIIEKKVKKVSKKTLFHFEDYQNYGREFQDWNLHEWQEFFFQLLRDDTAIEARTRRYRPTDWLLDQIINSEFIAAGKLEEK